jgi:hypothetical protein
MPNGKGVPATSFRSHFVASGELVERFQRPKFVAA